MKQKNFAGNALERGWLSRRRLIGGTGAMVGASLLRPKWLQADSDDDEGGSILGPDPNAIPGGVTKFSVFVHHNPLNAAIPLANINDPSQITDFDGLVGLTHIVGSGTGTDTTTIPPTVTNGLAYQADMGFSKGRFVGTDGRVHRGTFVFV